MSAEPAVRTIPWVEGQTLKSVKFDGILSQVEVVLERGRLEFNGVAATTFMGPWDGKEGVVEWLHLMHEDAGEQCFEMRLLFGPIPRVFRVVCRQFRDLPAT